MPVVLDPGSEGLRTWLDPNRTEWSLDLQKLLRPFSGEVEVYPVSKDVGKVGNDSPSFLIPIDSKDNKSNIANFFAKGSNNEKIKKSSPTKTPAPQPDAINSSETVPKRKSISQLAKSSSPKRVKQDKHEVDLKKISARKNVSKSVDSAATQDTPKITQFFKK